MELPTIQAFYSEREGLVELEDDVLSIVRQVRELYDGRVRVNWEPTTEHFVFVERCEDQTERLIFTSPHCDQRDLERLLSADSQRRGYEDPYERAEREQDEIQAAADQAKLDRVHDAGERLAWALGDGEFGPGYHQSIRVTKDLSAD